MRQVSLDYFRALVRGGICPELATILGEMQPLNEDICCNAAKRKYFFA